MERERAGGLGTGATESPSAPPARDRPGQVEVLVLGPARIRGACRPFARASAFELVVYLALHPGGVRNDVWATALWPDRLMAPATLHSTASSARRSLGRAADGLDHLPRSHGRLQLRPSVTTDWQRFRVLAASTDPVHWTSALDLVRGRPFDGLVHAEWAVFEGIVAEMEERVAELACRIADRHLGRGSVRAAALAARRGLLVSPYDERLYRRLLRCADLLGNPAGVERVMGELLSHLDPGSVVRDGAFDLEAVHPETAELYSSLSRRRRHDPGAATVTG